MQVSYVPFEFDNKISSVNICIIMTSPFRIRSAGDNGDFDTRHDFNIDLI